MEFYRYDIVRGEIASFSHLRLTIYELMKETPRGYWITRMYEGKRFILKDSKKRHAYPTKKEALVSLRARTKRRKHILSVQLRVCDSGLGLVEVALEKLISKTKTN